MTKLLTVVATFVLLSFSVISGDNDYENENIIRDDVNVEEFRRQLSNPDSESTEDQLVRLGKNIENPKIRKQRIVLDQYLKGMKNDETAKPCCTGMWGRSLRNKRKSSLRKSGLKVVDLPVNLDDVPKIEENGPLKQSLSNNYDSSKRNEISVPCCGMWGRSLRNSKRSLLKRSSVNGLISAEHHNEITSSKGLSAVSDTNRDASSPKGMKPIKLSIGSFKANDPTQYRKSVQKLN